MKSLSEIETTSKRASRAAGFSWGVAEEIAKGIRILELFEKYNVPLILFGGLTSVKILKEAFDSPMVVAAAVGNRLNYSEHSVQRLKNQLSSSPIRNAYYHDRSIFKYYD